MKRRIANHLKPRRKPVQKAIENPITWNVVETDRDRDGILDSAGRHLEKDCKRC